MLPCLRLRRRDVAVPLDLVVHGRGRPSQQLRDLPAAVAAVEAFLDKPPLRLRQPQICPGLGLPPFLPGSSGHAMSASSCTSSGRPLRPPPHRLRHPSAHVQLTSGTVRMKSVIELANSHMTQSTWVFVMDCARAIMALTWGSWGYGPAERWHLLPRPNYLIRIMPA